jgi:hypothetical protein
MQLVRQLPYPAKLALLWLQLDLAHSYSYEDEHPLLLYAILTYALAMSSATLYSTRSM